MNKNEFLEKVEFFLIKSGISATSFGILAAGEPNFVFGLRKGREAREKKQNRVLSFIARYELENKCVKLP